MLDERLTDGAPAAGDDVEHARGQPDLGRDLSEGQRCQRRLAGRFEDHRIAGRERRSHFPHRQQQGKIPGHDRSHDAERFPPCVDKPLGPDRHGLAVDLVCPTGVVLQHFGRERDLDVARLADGLSVVQCLEPGNLVDALDEPFGHLPQEAAALTCRHASPGTFEGGTRGGHGRIHVGRRGRRHFGDHRFGCRIDHRHGGPAFGLPPLSTDQQLFASELRHTVSPVPATLAPGQISVLTYSKLTGCPLIPRAGGAM